MGQVGVAPGESDRQLCARVHVAKENAGDRVCSAATWIPRFQDASHLASPWHCYRASGLEHDNGVRIRGRNLGDQVILMARKGQGFKVRFLALPLVSEHDSHISL